MEISTEALQKQLQEKIERLDKERAEQLKAFNKEQEQRKIIEAAEREERVKKIKEAEEKVAARKAEIEAAEAKRQQEAREAQIKADQLANEAQEFVRQQKEKLDWLTKAISDAEFIEEQHKKALESANQTDPTEAVDELEISEAVVNAHVLTGEAAAGTDGLEVGPSMSAHLRSILRRANSEVN
jgi:hypothetical protein